MSTSPIIDVLSWKSDESRPASPRPRTPLNPSPPHPTSPKSSCARTRVFQRNQKAKRRRPHVGPRSLCLACKARCRVCGATIKHYRKRKQAVLPKTAPTPNVEAAAEASEGPSKGQSGGRPTRCTIYRRKMRAMRDSRVLAGETEDYTWATGPEGTCGWCTAPRTKAHEHAFYMGKYFCPEDYNSRNSGQLKDMATWLEEQIALHPQPPPRTTAWRLKKKRAQTKWASRHLFHDSDEPQQRPSRQPFTDSDEPQQRPRKAARRLPSSSESDEDAPKQPQQSKAVRRLPSSTESDEDAPPPRVTARKPFTCQKCGHPFQAPFGHSVFMKRTDGKRNLLRFCALDAGKPKDLWLAEQRAKPLT